MQKATKSSSELNRHLNHETENSTLYEPRINFSTKSSNNLGTSEICFFVQNVTQLLKDESFERIIAVYDYLGIQPCETGELFYYVGKFFFSEKSIADSFTISFQCFQKSADMNNWLSHYILGNFYRYGYAGKMDFRLSFEHYSKSLVNGGYPESHLAVAECYLFGHGVVVNYKKAFEHLKIALQKQMPSALYYKGLIHYNALGVPRCIEKATIFFQKASELGHIESKYMLGIVYLLHAEHKTQSKTIYGLFKECSLKHHSRAQTVIALSYIHGIFTEKNITKSYNLFKSISVPNPISDYYVSLFYIYGCVVNPNINTSLEYALRSAQSGYTDSMFVTGILLVLQGKTKEGLEWLERSNSKGSLASSKTLLKLNITKKLLFNILDIFNFMDDFNFMIEAHYLLGYCYYSGTVVGIDLSKATQYLRISASHSHAPSMDLLALISRISRKTKTSRSMVFYLYKSLQNLSVKAKNNVAVCYYKGYGVSRNYNKAFMLINEDSNTTNIELLTNLAKCYHNGIGTGFDNEKATELFDLAAGLGSLEAMCYMNKRGIRSVV